ncbi:MAG: hypothetical protein LBI13_10085 [Streptococcaceae bacterium]|jgi:hypothetical protein|nr:hypothetical protein [Streptococcaceae bacterium]
MENANYFKSIEDILGNANGRYFGTGYKQVRYLQKKKEIDYEGIREFFEIQYPKNWSTKETTTVITPHFSTLDSVVLAVKLVTDFLREQLVVEENTINNALISKISVKAGKSLVEDLKNVEANLILASDSQLLFKGKVASFSVELIIELFDDSKQISVPTGEDYYFSAFESEENEVTDVSIMADLSSVSANADFQYDKTFSGVESAYLLSNRLPSILDQIIVTAELTEILHARLDNIPREKSKTLIMRKIEFSRTLLHEVTSRVPNNKTIKIEVLKTKMVHLGEKSLRTSDMISKFGNSSFTYSVAQEIPEILEGN